MALSALNFSRLAIYNGSWTSIGAVNPLIPLVFGTETTDTNSNGNDLITLTGDALNLNATVNGLSGNDKIDATHGVVAQSNQWR